MGSSNGAGMSHKLGINTKHFNAFAAIVTSLAKTNEPHKNTQPVAVLQILGMDDELIPYKGGKSRVGHDFYSGEESAKMWAQSNGCTMKPKTSKTKNGNDKIVYSDCKNGKEVVHYGIKGVGHGMPRNTEGGLHKLVWNFLKRF